MNKSQRVVCRVAAISLLGFAQLAIADEPAGASPNGPTSPPEVTHSASELGAATHAYLSLQSSNAAAAPARPMGGDEASLIYRRYLDSFKHPIPAFFASSTGKASGGSSGTSN